MEEKGRDRREDIGSWGTGIRVPAPGESSSPGTTPQIDSPTIIDIPGRKISDIPPRRISSDAPTLVADTGKRADGAFNIYAGAPMLDVGSVLAQRYQILNILGIGGMGAVYQARDLELNRTVALKVIRPDLAGNQSIIDRFKQELILATQVTHKNVVRIYDLGESEGMKFITMEFVEGQDLRSLIHERTKLPPEEAVDIMQQVCRALEAAHGVGVIHRDLKPQNIMRDVNGRVVVMDFGLARTLGGDGMTQSGALVGTMEYMSPEQALAQDLDQRSDIFSLGVIFYEMLSGAIPFRADSALASLIKRTQERVVPVSDLDETIPAALSAIVSRCLERDVNVRYQSALELESDLDAWQGKRPISQPVTVPQVGEKRWLGLDPRLVASSGVLAIVLAAGAGVYLVTHPPSGPAAKRSGAGATAALNLAVLPLQNMSGDPKLDWLGAYLADTLSTDIGQSGLLHTVSSDRLHQALADLQVTSGAAIDPDTRRHIIEITGTDIAISGQYARLGDQIQIDATVQDMKHDRTTAVKATAPNEQALPAAIDALADQIRKTLTLSSTQIDELKAQAFKPSSPSIEALRNYGQGMDFLRVGKNLDANQAFQAAVNADPQFALAYSALSQTQTALGHQADAEQSARRASELANAGGFPPVEKLLIDANHAAMVNDNKKAIELYENVARVMPGNVDVQYALGTLYADTGDYDKARAQFAKMLQADPKNVLALWRSGAVELQSGHFKAALDPLGQGESLTTLSDNKEQHAVILLAMGIAYQFLNKADEALRYFGESIAISEKLGQKRAVASAYVDIAELQATSLGKPDAALANYKKAIDIFQEIGSTKDAGDTRISMASLYDNRGDTEQALKMYREALQIERDAGDQNREALALNSIAQINLRTGDIDNAFTYYQQALQVGEKIGAPPRIADPLQGLGEAYTASGQYDQALASFKRALDTWRSNGNALGVATVQQEMGVVFGYQGRFGAAVDSIQQSVKGFQAADDKSDGSATALQSLALALARAGRGEEAKPYLDQAEVLARNLKDEALIAEVLATRGEIALYRGDLPAVTSAFQSALRSATQAGAREGILEAKLNLARLAIAQGHGADAVRQLRPLTTAGVAVDRHLALECSVTLAEALIQTKDYAGARRILEDVVVPVDKSGMRLLLARIYYLQATATRLSGNSSEAWDQYRQAMTVLNAVRNEQGAENILRRSDLKAIFDDCNRWVGVGAGAKSQ